MDKKRALKLLQNLDRFKDQAISGHKRAMWRPGTATGQKDYAQYERNLEQFDEAAEELRAIIEAMIK